MADPALVPHLQRSCPLDGCFAGAAGVTIVPAAVAGRISLRAPASSIAALSRSLDLALPKKPKTSTLSGDKDKGNREAGGWNALWLGPDEWLLLALGETAPSLDWAKPKGFFSAVDIGHRNTGLTVDGPLAAATLNGGCPQDLSTDVFPVGAASRTVLGKAEIVIWRTGPARFHVEVWRSFSDYLFGYLEQCARDAAI